MDQNTLFAFVKRSIETSPDAFSAREALTQLKSVLDTQLKKEDSKKLASALKGVNDSFPVMKQVLSELPAEPDTLEIAAERAERKRIQEEMDARNGRC